MEENKNNSQVQIESIRNRLITLVVGTLVTLGFLAWAFGWFRSNEFIGTWERKEVGKSSTYTITINDNETGTFSDGIITTNFTYKFLKGANQLVVYQKGKADIYCTINDNKDAIQFNSLTYSKKY